jgi:hypothetical protein
LDIFLTIDEHDIYFSTNDIKSQRII